MPMKASPPRPDDFPGWFETRSTAPAAPQDARREPVLTAPRFAVEFDPERSRAARLDQDRAGPARLDQARAGPAQLDQDRAGQARLDPARATAEPEPAPPASRRTVLVLGLILSLALHLMPLLVLLDWTSAPAAITQPIPVQLVVEEPPPPPPSPPVPAVKPPPPGRLASDNMGATKGTPDQSTAPAEPASDQPAETQIAALPPPKPIPPPKPPPEPVPPPALVSALPKPVPPPEPVTATMPEEPKPLFAPTAKQAAAARPPPNPHPPRRAQVLGPAASRDEYLAHCMNLIRSHFALSPAFLAGRSGTAWFELQVRDDGTITRVAVAQRSPHPDIDARIEQAVAAVRRFPPLPQWFQGPRISLILQVSYPEGL